jgi:hypothetical protein
MYWSVYCTYRLTVCAQCAIWYSDRSPCDAYQTEISACSVYTEHASSCLHALLPLSFSWLSLECAIARTIAAVAQALFA